MSEESQNSITVVVKTEQSNEQNTDRNYEDIVIDFFERDESDEKWETVGQSRMRLPLPDDHSLVRSDGELELPHLLVVDDKTGRIDVWDPERREKCYEQEELLGIDGDKITVRCSSCEYVWRYGGSRPNATCPECKSNNNLRGHESGLFPSK